MQKYTYVGWIHTDAIIIKTPDDKVARINDACKEDAGRLLYKIFYLSSLFVSFERVVPSLRVRERAGDRTLLKYFDPKVMAVSVVSFSFFMAAQPDPGVNFSVCWLSLLHRVYFCLPLYCLPSFSPISTGSLNSTDWNSTRRPYITFKLPRADMDMPPQLLLISGDWDVSLPLSLEWPV